MKEVLTSYINQNNKPMIYGTRAESSIDQATRINAAKATMASTYKNACKEKRGVLVSGVVRGGGCSG